MPVLKNVRRILMAFAVAMSAPAGALAQPVLKIFDSHLHYNVEATSAYSLDSVIELFRRNGIGGIVANSRPNRGSQMLVEAKAQGLWVVPFIRPYRVPSDVQNWFNDPAIYELIETEYKRGYYKGVGEFHLHGEEYRSPWVKKIVDFAVERDLYMLAHSDEQAILGLFSLNPKAKVIWAHTGFSGPEARVREMLDTYPTLWAELSYRSGISNGRGISAEWRDLFARHPSRFLLGSDTWVNQRWSSYESTMREYRGWLADLPADQARLIAHGNAERLYGGKIEP
jgi:amidohydrolase family protein